MWKGCISNQEAAELGSLGGQHPRDVLSFCADKQFSPRQWGNHVDLRQLSGGGKLVRAVLGIVGLLERVSQSNFPPAGPFSAHLEFNSLADDVFGILKLQQIVGGIGDQVDESIAGVVETRQALRWARFRKYCSQISSVVLTDSGRRWGFPSSLIWSV